MSRPDVHAHLDYRAYLDAWFRWRKADNPRFSHRAFVRRVGARSPSLLPSVISRRRNLSPRMAAAVADAMGLDEQERAFFLDLVAFDQARSEADCARAWRRIASVRRFRAARTLDAATLDVFAQWHHLAIYELARVPGFRADPAWICKRLRPRIRPNQARDALQTLTGLGLLAPRGDTLRPTQQTLTTPMEVAGVAAHTHHQGALDLARHALDHVPPEERAFHTVTVAVPESLLPRLRQRIEALSLELLDEADAADAPPDRVVQAVLAVYPVSQSIEEEAP